MTWTELVKKFLAMIEVIKRLNPAYKQPGDGSNGVCDCIGLIIGALKRMGIKWPGIHGSNYAARYQTDGLAYIERESQLNLGDAVYKAAEPDGKVRKACNAGYLSHRYDLPDRYKKGKQYCNNDFKDYYHVGVVTQLNPLRITHMTSPRMKVDTNLNGGWNYHGKVKPLVKAETNETPTQEPDTVPIPSTGSKAVVVAESGSTVNMRQGASLNKKIVMRVPVGQTVEIVSPGEGWAKVRYDGKYGYIMAKFLDVIGDGKGKY